MPKGRKDSMPTYTGLNGEKVAIKRGSAADKKRIKEKQRTYTNVTNRDKKAGKTKPSRNRSQALKSVANGVGATLAGHRTFRDAQKKKGKK